MLNKRMQIELAKILADNFSEGDWQELFIVTDCEDIPSGYHDFYRHVRWKNIELKGIAITALNETLNRAPGNLAEIWKLDRVEHLVKSKSINLSDEIEAVVNQSGQRNVSAMPVKNVNENIYQALEDAAVLLENTGPQRAYDRVHTALHASLRQICVNHAIAVDSTNDNVPGLLGRITAHLQGMPDDGRNGDILKMLRSAGSILNSINYLRNHNSMAHPTEMLLNGADARFAINLVRSIMAYIDELLVRP